MVSCACGSQHGELCMWESAGRVVHVGVSMVSCACGSQQGELCMWESALSIHRIYVGVRGRSPSLTSLEKCIMWQSLLKLYLKTCELYVCIRGGVPKGGKIGVRPPPP